MVVLLDSLQLEEFFKHVILVATHTPLSNLGSGIVDEMIVFMSMFFVKKDLVRFFLLQEMC